MRREPAGGRRPLLDPHAVRHRRAGFLLSTAPTRATTPPAPWPPSRLSSATPGGRRRAGRHAGGCIPRTLRDHLAEPLVVLDGPTTRPARGRRWHPVPTTSTFRRSWSSAAGPRPTAVLRPSTPRLPISCLLPAPLGAAGQRDAPPPPGWAWPRRSCPTSAALSERAPRPGGTDDAVLVTGSLYVVGAARFTSASKRRRVTEAAGVDVVDEADHVAAVAQPGFEFRGDLRLRLVDVRDLDVPGGLVAGATSAAAGSDAASRSAMPQSVCCRRPRRRCPAGAGTGRSTG